MKQWKRYVILICCMFIFVSCLVGCQFDEEKDTESSESKVNWNAAAEKYGEEDVE